MDEYCVYLKPEIDVIAEIQALREKHDPLAFLIPPHITVLFPFKTGMQGSQMIDSIGRNLSPGMFHFTLGPAVLKNSFAYFPLIDGKRESERMNTALYTNDLAKYRSLEHAYDPHITIGRYKSDLEGKSIIQDASIIELGSIGKISELVLERIQADGKSEIIHTWNLE